MCVPRTLDGWLVVPVQPRTACARAHYIDPPPALPPGQRTPGEESEGRRGKILTLPLTSSLPPWISVQPSAWTEHGTAAQASKSGVGARLGASVGRAEGEVVGAVVGAGVGLAVGLHDGVVAKQQLLAHPAWKPASWHSNAGSPAVSASAHSVSLPSEAKRAAQGTQSVGENEGPVEGRAVGLAVGSLVGLAEGEAVGCEVVGASVGWRVRMLPTNCCPRAAGSRVSASASASANIGFDRWNNPMEVNPGRSSHLELSGTSSVLRAPPWLAGMAQPPLVPMSHVFGEGIMYFPPSATKLQSRCGHPTGLA